jgi:hypothetical protein
MLFEHGGRDKRPGIASHSTRNGRRMAKTGGYDPAPSSVQANANGMMQAALTWRSLVRHARKGLPMEYREIRYTVRTRIERNEWTVSIHPAGIEGARRLVTGPRERAELLARSMVDRWHERAAGKAVRSKEARRIAANIAKLPALVHQRNRRRALKGAI